MCSMSSVDYKDEMSRYDNAYHRSGGKVTMCGSTCEEIEYREPYVQYEKLANSFIKKGMKVLEIAAGDGCYTNLAMKKNVTSIVTDISSVSLSQINSKVDHSKFNLRCVQCDMQSLPFNDNCFDVVLMSQSLSYGNIKIVFNEIFRILAPGGRFVMIDSLYDNYFYTINRWMKYKKGEITKSSYVNRVTLKKILIASSDFRKKSIKTYNSLVFLYPILSKIISSKNLSMVSDYFDSVVFFPKRFRFKVVGFFGK